MHVYYTYTYCLQNLTLQVLGNFWSKPKVYVDTTIYTQDQSQHDAFGHTDSACNCELMLWQWIDYIWLYLMVSPDNQSLCIWTPHSCRLPSLGVLFPLGMQMVSYSSMLHLILRGYRHRRVLHCLVLYPYICLNNCTHWNILYMWSWYCHVNKWGHIYSSMY